MSTVTDPYIFKVWDVSTCHVTKEDMEKLRLSDNPACAISYEYGINVICTCDDEQFNEALVRFGMSPEFCALYKKAVELGVSEMRLDEDGTQYTDLPQFDW